MFTRSKISLPGTVTILWGCLTRRRAAHPFTDNKNLVLFPQFKAKQYKVILNYGEAPVTGIREIDVDYNSELPELPINLTLANKDFKGWYTEPNCGGTQIADTYGVLPERRLVTEQNFNLTNANGYIYLYAGFKGTMRTVTFYVGDNIPIEMQIEHGTKIADIVPDYRTEEGFAVLEWAQDPNPTENSPVFKGEITGDMTLYAKTYAPVIEFDANGGEKIVPLVQTAGKKITLPTPVRTNYKFLYWADAGGEKINYAVMPSASVKATAVWQAMIIFDENGGADVKDISQETGTALSLPKPEKEGFIFAGWYTSDGEKYESTSMPSVSKTLKAGWYKIRTKEKVFLTKNQVPEFIYMSEPEFLYSINFAEEILEVDWNKTLKVNLKFSAEIRHHRDSFVNADKLYPTKQHIEYYSRQSASDVYLLDETVLNHGEGTVDTNYGKYNWEVFIQVPKTNIVFLALSSDKYEFHAGWQIANFYVVVEYPDTSVMY